MEVKVATVFNISFISLISLQHFITSGKTVVSEQKEYEFKSGV